MGDVRVDGLEVYGPGEAPPPSDVVVLATKANDNASMAPVVASAVGPGSVVLVLQNGLDVERPVAEALPGTTVLGGMSFICSHKAGPGRVEHLDYEAVTIGEYRLDGSVVGVTPAVEAAVADLVAAGVPTTALDDVVAGRWRKLVWNVPFNGLSVVLDAGTDELMGDPSARRLVVDLMEEVVAASVADGHPVPPGVIGEMLERTEKMTPYAPSMKLDYLAGRPIELAPIYGAPLAAATAAGCPMPRTTALHDQLCFLDARNRARRAGADRRPGPAA
jgi:2-dehydropantoate 2-reductase